MATLPALLADVYSLTNRPDLVAESTVAVKAATLKAHQSDYYQRDIVTGSQVFANPTLLVQTFSITGLPRWRAWSYLQNFDPLVSPYQGSGAFVFDIIAPNDLIDQYNVLKQNTAWQAGTNLNIRCAAALATLYYGYYRNQDVTNAGDMGWISDSHPYAIIGEATRRVFKIIGYDEQAAYYEKVVQEEYENIRLSNVTVLGM